ncbi:MAG: C40 family peptidase [Mailhella sp.]|nr:C40 family peptidase [Mailhella sp.]
MKKNIHIFLLAFMCLLLGGPAFAAPAARYTEQQVQNQQIPTPKKQAAKTAGGSQAQKRPVLPQTGAKKKDSAVPTAHSVKPAQTASASKNARTANTSALKKEHQPATPKSMSQKQVPAKTKQTAKGQAAPGGIKSAKPADKNKANSKLAPGSQKIGAKTQPSQPQKVIHQSKTTAPQKQSADSSPKTSSARSGNKPPVSVKKLPAKQPVNGSVKKAPDTLKESSSAKNLLEHPDQTIRNSIISVAKTQMGVKYRRGGTSPSTGFDCSGFVHWVYGQNKMSIPRSSRSLLSSGKEIPKTDARPGDVIVFKNVGGSFTGLHSAIFLGEGRFIHSPNSRSTVSINSLEEKYWKSHDYSVLRFIDSKIVNVSSGRLE